MSFNYCSDGKGTCNHFQINLFLEEQSVLRLVACFLQITTTGKHGASTGIFQSRDPTTLRVSSSILDVLVDLFNFYSTRRAEVKPVYGLGVGFNLVNICAIFNLLNQQTANSFVTCINKKHKTILSRFYFHS